MHTTNVAYMQESKFQEQTLRYSLDNGDSKLDHVSESSKETIVGLLDIFYRDVLKNTTFQSASNQKFSKTGTDQDVTPITPLQK